MPKKKTAVNYTSRDFNSIKAELVDYAKRYYPDTFRDFNEASFGALMLDTVAYVGDMLSFYLDYQANESFLSTAIEYDNVIKLIKQTGFRLDLSPTATGTVTFYIIVPASATANEPDTAYMPVLEKGTELSTVDGRNFVLNQDIDFANVQTGDVVPARQDPTTGLPTYFALKARGPVISGDLLVDEIEVGAFEKFRKVGLRGQNITEILSVVDSNGNEYYEVDYLTQDVIYKSIKNRNEDKDVVGSVLSAISVPRRYVVEKDRTGVNLLFGFGSDSELTTQSVVDPSNVVLKVYGKDYYSTTTLDPSRLLQTDKLGVGPANTTLTVKYRVNSAANMNTGVGALSIVKGPLARFSSINTLNTALVSETVNSLEVTNEEQIVGSVSYPSTEELRKRALSTFATQSRAVTKQDYIAMAYNMPAQFGAIKRCNILQDKDSLKRNLNLYVLSEDNNGKFILANNTLKRNLKTWLTSVKMINDTIDILDPVIVNLGINFRAVIEYSANRFEIMNDVTDALETYFETKPNMAQPFFLSDIYNVINDVSGIVDAEDVVVYQRTGLNYASAAVAVSDYTSPDGRVIQFPENTIWEVKYPKSDIRGVLR